MKWIFKVLTCCLLTMFLFGNICMADTANTPPSTIKATPIAKAATPDPLEAKLPESYERLNKPLNTLANTFRKARIVVYMLGAFGFIGFAVAAFFGKLSWSWLVMITVSLFVLSSTEAIVLYAINAGKGDAKVMKSSDVHRMFNDSENKLNLRDDSSDFDYNKISDIKKNAVKSSVK